MDDVELDFMIAHIRDKSKSFDGDHVLRDAPMSEDRITELERERNIVLNRQYRRFLMTYGAGDFLYSQIYSFDPNSDWNLWRESDFVDGIGTTILPFSDNGAGDYLAFKLLDGKCSDCVYWIDHELGYTISDSEYEDFNKWVAECALQT
ncbi:SMI1 / KNR4 family protein [Novipirellula aureliae]|uniref:SMI1 / KNR4 family protein n=1 Tax=Novipirellula aureliae TaxID=2527966 RepID=A0A5C6DBY8_9BACT|nr:SMI1/KNR4 family protein [Novipirellula aureliae]TWU32439.1 SMI1 / KNR4 family protein [Novipirellula aureliae]